jgi:uncharacterized membrane-anchored protein
MTTRALPQDHPQRYPLALELHARPFPPVTSPSQAIQLAFKPLDDRIRDTAAHRDHLFALLDRFGAARPAKDSAHFYTELGRLKLKWERHTEFISYTFYQDGRTDAPFDLGVASLAPQDWLNDAPGALISAINLHIEPVDSLDAADKVVNERLHRYFVAESTAASHVADGQATVVGDFRIHEDGFSRFAVLTNPSSGARRVGRIVQRLIELENYRMLAMLALPMARDVTAQLNEIETELTGVISEFSTEARNDHDILVQLSRLSAAIEALSAETAFRFSASTAYSALVDQRIETLGERRVAGRQTLSEFMARRFKPAMRTCAAAEKRLHDLADRASRTVRLLSARVNVTVETQNQDLLESMNRRAEMQLRLQRTVEGLSVVAISYYAVSLAGYFIAPAAPALDLSKEALTALVAAPIILGVWGFIRRIRHALENETDS